MVAKCKPYGEEISLFFKLRKYSCNDRYQIQAYEYIKDDGGETSYPYASITVNLPFSELPEPKLHGFYCFIDTNNCPWAEQLLLDTGIGIPTGQWQTSGFCNYPVYFIFTSNLRKYKG